MAEIYTLGWISYKKKTSHHIPNCILTQIVFKQNFTSGF